MSRDRLQWALYRFLESSLIFCDASASCLASLNSVLYILHSTCCHVLLGLPLFALWSGKCLMAGSLGTLRAHPLCFAFLGNSSPVFPGTVSETMVTVYFVLFFICLQREDKSSTNLSNMVRGWVFNFCSYTLLVLKAVTLYSQLLGFNFSFNHK